MDSLKKLEKNDMKYIFFDIDGTLTDNTTGKIVPSAQEALDKLQENGNFVAIATGRAYYKAKNFLKEVGLNNMVCNGGNACHKSSVSKKCTIGSAKSIGCY